MDTQQNTKAENIKPAPPVLRFILVICFYIISILCALNIADKIITSYFLADNTSRTSAYITEKSVAKGKFGTRYYINYVFKKDNAEFTRSSFFTALTQKTQVSKKLYDSTPEQTEIKILYSNTNPKYNKPEIEEIINDKTFWVIAGFIIFFILAINETKTYLKKRKSS